MKQQSIEVPEPKRDSRSLHEILVGILREFGPRKDEAIISGLENELGRQVSKGHFSEVKDGKKHWPLDWIDYIVDHFDHRNEVATYYARRRKMRVCPPRRRSVAEELRRIRFVLGNHNGLGKAVRDEADALPDDIFADEEEF